MNLNFFTLPLILIFFCLTFGLLSCAEENKKTWHFYIEKTDRLIEFADSLTANNPESDLSYFNDEIAPLIKSAVGTDTTIVEMQCHMLGIQQPCLPIYSVKKDSLMMLNNNFCSGDNVIKNQIKTKYDQYFEVTESDVIYNLLKKREKHLEVTLIGSNCRKFNIVYKIESSVLVKPDK